MKIIGLDVGEKRIGVAKADSSTKIAVPVGFVLVDGSEWQEIAKIANLNNTNFFVLGLPRSNEGNETKQTLYVRAFARILAKMVPGAKIRFQDESLTSVEAEKRLKSRKKNYEKGDIDAEAASIILQDFIENFKEEAAKPAATTKPKTSKTNLHLPKESLETLETIQTIAKKEKNKVALNAKKTEHKLKKWTVFGIPAIIIVLGLLGATAALKYRDYKRWEYEQWVAEQEAKMVAKTFNFTIRPGETIFDIKKELLKVDRSGGTEPEEGEEPIVNYTKEEIEAAFNAEYDYEFLKNRPKGASLEGYLFPETLNFYSTDTVEDILKKFLTEMEKVITENDLEAKYATHGLSLHEGIIIASIVQRESTPSDVATVAQVLMTRLSYGWTLGADATVSYALDVADPDRTIYKDNSAALQIDSCYNTRLHTGLPCGAISNPGLDALLAVANPSDTSYLYFLTGDDGLMYYSTTEAEHSRNIYYHCKVLCNVSLWRKGSKNLILND